MEAVTVAARVAVATESESSTPSGLDKMIEMDEPEASGDHVDAPPLRPEKREAQPIGFASGEEDQRETPARGRLRLRAERNERRRPADASFTS